jgi:hypothetical protein
VIAVAIALMLKEVETVSERVRVLVKGLTDKYPLL